MEKLVIQSDSAALERVEQYVSRLCDERNIRNHFATISTALTHAVENAVCHGNHYDASKSVVVECGDCDGGIYFLVSDMGDGFDTSVYQGFPTEGGGEGLFIMGALADKMTFNAKGNTVRLEFLIQGIDRALTLERIAKLKQYYQTSEVKV